TATSSSDQRGLRFGQQKTYRQKLIFSSLTTMSTETIHNPCYNLRRPGQSQRQGTPASAASVNDETQAQHRPTSYNEAAQGGRMTPKGDGNTPSDGESVAGSLKDEQHKLVEPDDNSLTNDDENPNQWVQVGSRRRATSLDSSQLYKIPLKSVRVKDANSGYSPKKVPVPITMAQGAVIREAEKGLSQAQRKMIASLRSPMEKDPLPLIKGKAQTQRIGVPQICLILM
ncbi:hypothetical protein DFH05DRAFT_1484149, partial [Lentinula detonsa]